MGGKGTEAEGSKMQVQVLSISYFQDFEILWWRFLSLVCDRTVRGRWLLVLMGRYGLWCRGVGYGLISVYMYSIASSCRV